MDTQKSIRDMRGRNPIGQMRDTTERRKKSICYYYGPERRKYPGGNPFKKFKNN